MATEARNLIFVTVGTDHHPFDRLCGWFDEWMTAGRHQGMECLVQSGTSRPPVAAPASDYVRYDEMVSAMSRSVAVVCHGGPATIMDARRYGRIPLVLPRNADLGEHVDNHQQRFARKMAELGQIHLITCQEELFEHLDKAVADPDAYALEHDGDEIAAAVKRFEHLVDGLFVKR